MHLNLWGRQTYLSKFAWTWPCLWGPCPSSLKDLSFNDVSKCLAESNSNTGQRKSKSRHYGITAPIQFDCGALAPSPKAFGALVLRWIFSSVDCWCSILVFELQTSPLLYCWILEKPSWYYSANRQYSNTIQWIFRFWPFCEGFCCTLFPNSWLIVLKSTGILSRCSISLDSPSNSPAFVV